MYLSIINDCNDPGTMNRQVVRAASLFPNMSISSVGVNSYGDLEASGHIIDTLDAALGEPGIILANVAPRHGKAKKWENGTPFGHIKVGDTNIFATVDGFTLSQLSKLGLAKDIEVYDIPTVTEFALKQELIDEAKRQYIVNTQFRSYEFLPRVARWYVDGIKLPFDSQPLSEFMTAPLSIWFIDNFGNCKTTALSSDIGHEPGKKIKTNFGEIQCYSRLKDVPDGEEALTLGSSGYGEDRYVELVVQGESGAKHFGASVGDKLIS